ncbi:uncharacterized protein Z520_10041 [Fonsecaea multimorphosa CBS 102226]|uniref:Uncharacterized protein n=1 Tax=Fonsecaea multimorphosa CBS 102226 TaxID=1442371 RepID=A0A0D2IB04_9EURO|nr:uncharacterized protein Z520_10041 [Fonsecaea multimorphosa CBS 102226]KIX94331.1 hypothetical protein Z520_10041 [Fonsecaea multimorphosa CBS 102226]OAL19665.1 hypothetical protein AYO22_09537 [Fonsecaea multimorphosa]
MSRPRLDTSYVDFESDKGVRSPRTPTYEPVSPSIDSMPPFDPTKYSTESSPKGDDRLPHPPPPPPPPQQQPVPWMWICHLCHSRYPLGVTRRCLVDGHYYCSGQTDRPSLRKKKKPKACSSEFDYVAWKSWGAWRRGILKLLENERVSGCCQHCDFPSQCRYPANSHPLVKTQATLVFPNAPVCDPLPELETQTAEVDGKDGAKSKANENVDFDQILENIYTDTMSQTSRSEKSLNTKKQNKNASAGRKKRSGKTSTPSLEDDLAEEERRLRELVGPDLWSCLEDVGLDHAPTE